MITKAEINKATIVIDIEVRAGSVKQNMMRCKWCLSLSHQLKDSYQKVNNSHFLKYIRKSVTFDENKQFRWIFRATILVCITRYNRIFCDIYCHVGLNVKCFIHKFVFSDDGMFVFDI